MQFQVDQDRGNLLKFYIVPVNRADLASRYLAGIYQRVSSGSPGPDSVAATRCEITGEVVAAFKNTDAYVWLRKNAKGKAELGGEFSATTGVIPIPRISVTFNETKVASNFKFFFGCTLLMAASPS